MTPTKRMIADLKPHPAQQEIYGDAEDAVFQALVEDIVAYGLRQAIEVTPDGTIVDGHQRVRAYQRLNRPEIDVIVVDDLNEYDVKERFIRANLDRRQLDVVAKARAIKALVEIEYARRGEHLDDNDIEFREQVANRIGNVSGRTLSRYLQLLRLPRTIQDAVSRRQLPLTKALKIESLSKGEQQQIADRLAAGEAANKLFGEYFSPSKTTSETPRDLYRMLIDFLEESLRQLEDNTALLIGGAGNHDSTAAILERAQRFCERMRKSELGAKRVALNAIADRLNETTR